MAIYMATIDWNNGRQTLEAKLAQEYGATSVRLSHEMNRVEKPECCDICSGHCQQEDEEVELLILGDTYWVCPKCISELNDKLGDMVKNTTQGE